MNSALENRIAKLENPDGPVLLPDPGRDANRVVLLDDMRRRHPGKQVGFLLPMVADPDDFI